ncbi:hypothetical protein J31TS4_29120 [Paenibacillus sp. J31TS4]|uniref:hypothetical protein n=1 Tax=Paenibacillus sp. J31TS4 TaxID=2807195 RepID=UPI001B140E4D|nr:hypothetical protein [Paenibacillus sp. J31TS4]GIP39632.1 hypothetical protein J31TS4_29120 [Paenibacillus sp. J31TS4]
MTDQTNRTDYRTTQNSAAPAVPRAEEADHKAPNQQLNYANHSTASRNSTVSPNGTSTSSAAPAVPRAEEAAYKAPNQELIYANHSTASRNSTVSPNGMSTSSAAPAVPRAEEAAYKAPNQANDSAESRNTIVSPNGTSTSLTASSYYGNQPKKPTEQEQPIAGLLPEAIRESEGADSGLSQMNESAAAGKRNGAFPEEDTGSYTEEYAGELAAPVPIPAAVERQNRLTAEQVHRAADRTERTETREQETDRPQGRTLGWVGLITAILSLFVFPTILGPTATVLGFLAYLQGNRTMGVWSVVLGLISLGTALFLSPYFR